MDYRAMVFLTFSPKVRTGGNDKIEVWPTPVPVTFGDPGILDIPEQFRDDHQDGTGIILSIGDGYWGKYKKKSKWFSPSHVLVPGVHVFFDKSVPWFAMFQGLDGKMHKVAYCGFLDIHGLCEHP